MSNSNTCAAEGPRPWYVSVTALWCELVNFPALRLAVEAFLESRRLPVHHLAVPPDSWHSTVLEVLRINWFPTKDDRDDTFSSFATSLFTQLRGHPGLEKSLKKALKPLTLEAYEVRCHDDGTTVQFKESNDLEELRTCLRELFRRSVTELADSTVSKYRTQAAGKMHPVVEPLVDSSKKNRGSLFYGSFARSPSRADSSILRWIKQIKPAIPLSCTRYHLLVSDEALTNPRQLGENDLLFPTNQRT